MTTSRGGDYLYVYAVAERVAAGLPETRLRDSSAPRALSFDPHLTVVVSDVAAATYNPASLEARLGDLDWVGAAGEAHHAVIEQLVTAATAVLPFRLFTIFSSEQAARAVLKSKRSALLAALGRVRGRQEWVLRIGAPDPGRRQPSVPAPSTTSGHRGGTTFLAGKADARRAAVERAERARRQAGEVFTALQGLADESVGRAVDPGGRVLVDAAFLLQPAGVNRIKHQLTRAAAPLLADGCAVSFTGPWPPYSFASLPEDRHG